MKKIFILICASVFLTGCAPLLERQSVTVEPHSSKFWESEAAGTLRAESHQDIVNDLLLLIDRHEENATIRLYHFEDDLTVSDTLEKAAMEIQKETPLGSYAVSYITSSSQAQRGYYEVKLQIGYRRTAEQLRAIVNATSTEAVYSLLRDALRQGKSELAVRIGYWGSDGQARVEEAVNRLREERETPEDFNLNASPDFNPDADATPDFNLNADINHLDLDINNMSNHDDNSNNSNNINQADIKEAETAAESEETKSPETEKESGETALKSPETDIIWPITRYYPESGPVGLVEFILDVQPEENQNNPENLYHAENGE